MFAVSDDNKMEKSINRNKDKWLYLLSNAMEAAWATPARNKYQPRSKYVEIGASALSRGLQRRSMRRQAKAAIKRRSEP